MNTMQLGQQCPLAHRAQQAVRPPTHTCQQLLGRQRKAGVPRALPSGSPLQAAPQCGHGARLLPARAAAVAEPVPLARGPKIPPFPFVKIAGQEDMKLALLLNIVDPNIGGVLIMGDRGTAKSVVVRAVVQLLPEIDVVQNDGFNSSPTDPKLMGPDALERFKAGETLPAITIKTPLVELPLGATEDRICGTIDIEKALLEGIRAYEPGLLARANRGILYVDEVNLLDDSLVDVVLDASAGGINTVEREGISIVHPAKFIMIGSGNPQEGELRPQLLDRFGLAAQVATLQDPEKRTQMVLDRIAYDKDPDRFCSATEPEQQALRDKLMESRDRLSQVTVPREIKLKISEICALVNVDGLRGDIVINRAAKAFVAFEGRTEVTLPDVERVVGMCLNHRLRKDPLDPIDSGTKVKLAFQRITNPKKAQDAKAAAAAAAGAPAAAAAAGGEAKEGDEKREGLKAGAWKGIGV